MTSRTKTRSQRAPRMMRKRNQSRSNGNPVGDYVGDAWSLAKRTALGLNEIRKLINVEEKYFDRSALAFPPSQAGVSIYLTNMGQGDDINSRDGDSIKVQRFTVDAQISRNALSTAQGEWVRMIVVRDLQNPGAALSGSDVIAQASTVLAPISPYNVLNGPQYNKRFSIVCDESVRLDSNNTASSISYQSSHDCHVYFRGTTSAQADAGNGTYFALFFCNTTTNLPSIDFISRLVFTDN